MLLLFDNAASSLNGTHCTVIFKPWIISSCGLITVITLHLERGMRVGVPVEFEKVHPEYKSTDLPLYQSARFTSST